MYHRGSLYIGKLLYEGRGDETKTWLVERIGEPFENKVFVTLRGRAKQTKTVRFLNIDHKFVNYDLRGEK